MAINVRHSKKRIKFILFNVFNKINLWKLLLSRNAEAKILMYHRISDDPLIPGISSSGFEKHLQFLTKHYNVVPIEEVISERKNGIKNPSKIAITFDDGYVDFYHKAWPILKKHAVSASIYIATDFIDKEEWLWPDKIRMLLLSTRVDSVQLNEIGNLELNKEKYESNWNTIADYCLNLNSEARSAFIKKLENSLSVELARTPNNQYAALTWEQLKEMANEGLDIGSHTLSHPILANISDKQIDEELKESKSKIENKLKIAVTGICYPNGMRSDISKYVLVSAQRSGYQYGLLAYSDSNQPHDDYNVQRVSASECMSDFAFNLLD